MPTAFVETTRHFEWDTPWSMGALIAACSLLGVWILWQLVREARQTQSQWTFLFVGLRAIVLGILIWMILGPTSVQVRKESHPRTLAVYVDSSSSMETQDQPDEVADRRWTSAALNASDPIVAADRIVLYASAMRQQLVQLAQMIEQQQPSEERLECVTKWQQLAESCQTWLKTDILKSSLTSDQQELLQELLLMLESELLPCIQPADWITGTDPGDREDRLRRMAELGDQFSARCHALTDGVLPVPEPRASSALPESAQRESRLERVTQVLRSGIQAWRGAGNDAFQLQLSQFSNKVSHLPNDQWEQSLPANESTADRDPSTRGTDLADLFKQIRDDSEKDDLAAIVVMTDGRHTAEVSEDPRDLAAQLNVPLYFVPIGRHEMKRDVILHHLHAPTSVIEKDKILIEGTITAHRCEGDSCQIQLLEGSQVLETRTLSLAHEQEDQRFQFEVPTTGPGRREFKVHVLPIVDEHSTDNNTSSLAVDVVPAVLKILIADNVATWEHQHLINLFKRQDQVEFDELKFLPKPIGTGKRKATAQFPETADGWSEYRVVILGDVGPRQLNSRSQNALREYVVQRGGCLIVIAGRKEMPQAFQNEPLESLLPVTPEDALLPAKSGYRIELTAEGKSTEAMQLSDDLADTEAVWRDMCHSMPVWFLSRYHKPKPSSHVLLSAISRDQSTTGQDNAGFLIWQQIGAGRVAFLSSPSTYQLRMRNGDQYFHRFWGQLLRWIVSGGVPSGSKSVKLMTDKSNYQQGDSSQITVELRDLDGRPVLKAAPQVEVTHHGELRSRVSLTPDAAIPGKYHGQFTTEVPGRYTLRVQGPDADRLLAAEGHTSPVQLEIEFEASLNRELIDVRSDRPLLEQLAEQSGGLVLEPTAVAELSRVLSLKPRTLETSQRTALWDRWWCLWLILGCLSLEWVLRKQIGLA
ncbi:MAG: hypothetical protein U0929_10710 [Planctomycetaceae bacterium]